MNSLICYTLLMHSGDCDVATTQTSIHFMTDIMLKLRMETVGAVTDPECKNTPLLSFIGLLVPVGYFKNPISISLRCKYQTCFGKIETRYPRSCIIIFVIVVSVLLLGQRETSWKPGDSFGSNDRCLSNHSQQTVLLFN